MAPENENQRLAEPIFDCEVADLIKKTVVQSIKSENQNHERTRWIFLTIRQGDSLDSFPQL